MDRKQQRRFRFRTMAMALLVPMAAGALAQDMSFQPDYIGSNALSNALDGNAEAAKREPAARSPEPTLTPAQQAQLKNEMQRRIAAHRQQLLPEYQRRVQRDGRDSADAWLREVAQRLGRQDANELRAKYSR